VLNSIPCCLSVYLYVQLQPTHKLLRAAAGHPPAQHRHVSPGIGTTAAAAAAAAAAATAAAALHHLGAGSNGGSSGGVSSHLHHYHHSHHHHVRRTAKAKQKALAKARAFKASWSFAIIPVFQYSF
jgi:hypothetical protein